MTTRPALLVISSDSHVSEPPDLWETRLPKALRNQAPHFLPRGEGRLGDRPGGFDPAERAKEMAADGVDVELVYPTLGLTLYKMQDAPLQEACFRVYNEWVREYCATAAAPVYAIGMIPTYNIEKAVAELEWCHAAGMPGAVVWQVPHPDLPFTSDHYDPLWDAAQTLGMPISVHILTGFNYSAGPRRSDFDSTRNSVNRKTADMMDTMYDVVYSGVLERFPRLRLVLVEGEVGWIPFTLQQWDYYYHRFKRVRKQPTIRQPSDYFYRQISATFFNDPVGGQLFSWWGTDSCLWSNDYPHGNSPWPHSMEVLERNLGHLQEQTVRKLFHDNVTKLYGLTLS